MCPWPHPTRSSPGYGETASVSTVVLWRTTRLWARLRSPQALAATDADAGAMAISAGLDIELPTAICYSELPDLVRQGDLDEAILDRAVARSLTQRFQVGLFDSPTVDPKLAPTVFAAPEALDLGS